MIFHFSYDFGQESEQKSLNRHTPEEVCSVHYNDLDEAVANCLKVKQDQRNQCDHNGMSNIQFEEEPIYLGKLDVKSAFRLAPLSLLSWTWLVMMAVNPKTKRKQFFVDKCLPFRASISCTIFQRFSNALKHLIQFGTKTQRQITNYLDDFLFIAFCKVMCNYMIGEFLDLCASLGIPIAEEKTEWTCTRLIFLGIMLDGESMILAVPEEKCNKAIYLLNKMKDKKKSTVRDLQVLCGYLNFLNKAIYPGRAFTCRMYSKYAVQWEKRHRNKSTFKFKPYHHIKLDREFKSDCKIWLTFLQHEDLRKGGGQAYVGHKLFYHIKNCPILLRC